MKSSGNSPGFDRLCSPHQRPLSRWPSKAALLLGAALCALATYVLFVDIHTHAASVECDNLERISEQGNELEALQHEVEYLTREMQRKEADIAELTPPVVISNKVPLDRIAVLGERNRKPGLLNIKHYFQTPHPSGAADTARTLIILVVRNPYDWLSSMHRTCYCCEGIDSQHTTLEEFLHIPFNLTMKSPYSGEERPTPGCPIDINIFKPGDGHFKNVMAARYEKILHFMNISRMAAGFELVQHEEVITGEEQQAWFTKIAEKWELPANEEFTPMIKDARFWKEEDKDKDYFTINSRMATSPYLNHTILATDEDQRKQCELKNAVIDGFMEEIVGYKVLDCSGSDA